MAWEKLGLIYRHQSVHPALLTHAANPKVLHLKDDIFRVFFSSRNASKHSSVGFVDLDVAARNIVNHGTEPVMQPGPAGSFFEHGISIGSPYQVENDSYIPFMGWQVRPDRHWWGEMGRLKLEGEIAMLDPSTPIIGLDEEDPISISYPHVIFDGEYQMWYGSTVSWDAGNGEMLHIIKHATSTDGKQWVKQGLAIPYELGVAQAFSCPTVIKSGEGLEMWFSYRSGLGDSYRIGYAKSADGKMWKLALDESGIDVSPEGWDSEMICYPCVFSHDGERYLLYNGNDFGRDGFGLAIWRD